VLAQDGFGAAIVFVQKIDLRSFDGVLFGQDRVPDLTGFRNLSGLTLRWLAQVFKMVLHGQRGRFRIAGLERLQHLLVPGC